MTSIATRLRKLSSGWYAAAAAAAAAGATLVPERRVLAGLVGGLAVLGVGLWKSEPCCDGCAAGQGCAGTAPPPAPPATELELKAFDGGDNWLDFLQGSGDPIIAGTVPVAAPVPYSGGGRHCA